MQMATYSTTENSEVFLPFSRQSHGILTIFKLQQALQTAAIELKLARSIHDVETISKDEAIRKLRLQILLLEDENQELHEQLMSEEEHAEQLEQDLEDALARSDELEEAAQRATNDLRSKARELDIKRVSSLYKSRTVYSLTQHPDRAIVSESRLH